MSTVLGRRLSPEARIVTLVLALFVFEGAATLAYLQSSGTSVQQPRYVLYPWLWINAAILGVAFAHVGPVGWDRRRVAAALVGLAYFLVLGWIGGLFGSGGGPGLFQVVWATPGWGPTVLYFGPLVHVTLVPFKVVGYAALAYLVYGTVFDASRAIIGGIVGLVSCVSCTLPIAAALLSGVLGGSVAAAGPVSGISIDLSTAVFLLSVAVLVYRPFE